MYGTALTMERAMRWIAAALSLGLAVVPGVQEVSIGHALVADALELGLVETVRAYQRCIRSVSAATRHGG